MSVTNPPPGGPRIVPPSPRYSAAKNRKKTDSPGDGRLSAALDAVKSIARLDPDHARLANGIGFSASDARLGHLLARMSAEQLRDNKSLAKQVLAMAARYRKQVSPGLRYTLHLTAQRDLFA